MMRSKTTSRVWHSVAILAAFLTVWLTTPTAWAEVCLDSDTAQTVRDKARGYEAICQRLPASARPDWLAVLCEDPGVTSEWWVKAEQYPECRDRLRALQREANADKGALSEARRQTRGWTITAIVLGVALGGVSAGWAWSALD